jgi:hypothetical protein
MDDKERQTLREHIVWLGSQLEQERKAEPSNCSLSQASARP